MVLKNRRLHEVGKLYRRSATVCRMTGYFLIVERICYVAITGLKPRQDVTVNVTREDGSTFSFTTTAR